MADIRMLQEQTQQLQAAILTLTGALERVTTSLDEQAGATRKQFADQKLLVDAVALWAIAGRISDYGFSPNKVAALGENIILLANLGWSAVLYARFLTGRAPFAKLERWQTAYVPVYALWAWTVVLVFPPLFGFR